MDGRIGRTGTQLLQLEPLGSLADQLQHLHAHMQEVLLRPVLPLHLVPDQLVEAMSQDFLPVLRGGPIPLEPALIGFPYLRVLGLPEDQPGLSHQGFPYGEREAHRLELSD